VIHFRLALGAAYYSLDAISMDLSIDDNGGPTPAGEKVLTVLSEGE
jgi:hypothetical protein